MTDRELMQQALDALEIVNQHCFVLADYEEPMKKAIEAIRARLAQPEQEPVWVEVTTNTGDKFILDSAVEADKIRAAKDAGLSVVPLYTAPPQREWQWPNHLNDKQGESFSKPTLTDDETEFAEAMTVLIKAGYGKEAEIVLKCKPAWQGLTENEIKHLWYEACQTNLELTSQLIVHLARNIEAKLKEKNT